MRQLEAFTTYKSKLQTYQQDHETIILNPAEFVFFVLDTHCPPIDRHTFSIRNDFNQKYLKTLLREFHESKEPRILPDRLAQTMSQLTRIELSFWKRTHYSPINTQGITIQQAERGANSQQTRMTELASKAVSLLVDENSGQWRPNTFFISNNGRLVPKWAAIGNCCEKLSPSYIVTWLCETPPDNDPLQNLRLDFIRTVNAQTRSGTKIPR